MNSLEKYNAVSDILDMEEPFYWSREEIEVEDSLEHVLFWFSKMVVGFFLFLLGGVVTFNFPLQRIHEDWLAPLFWFPHFIIMMVLPATGG